jgi:hypothetical protein
MIRLILLKLCIYVISLKKENSIFRLNMVIFDFNVTVEIVFRARSFSDVVAIGFAC